jgi:hypothetical protein
MTDLPDFVALSGQEEIMSNLKSIRFGDFLGISND